MHNIPKLALFSPQVYTVSMPDAIIQKIGSDPAFVGLIARAWYVLAIEGSTPDIGRRRENLVRLALRNELHLQVEEPEQQMGRQLGFYCIIEGERRPYSFKSTCSHTLKVAWDGSVNTVESLGSQLRQASAGGSELEGSFSCHASYDGWDLVKCTRKWL